MVGARADNGSDVERGVIGNTRSQHGHQLRVIPHPTQYTQNADATQFLTGAQRLLRP